MQFASDPPPEFGANLELIWIILICLGIGNPTIIFYFSCSRLSYMVVVVEYSNRFVHVQVCLFQVHIHIITLELYTYLHKIPWLWIST